MHIRMSGLMKHPMRMSGRRRHLLSSRSAQDALANVLVRQHVQLHDLLPLGVPVQYRNLLDALTRSFTSCIARNMQLRSPAGAEKCGNFAAVVASTTQEPSKRYLLCHGQLCVGNVNLKRRVCYGLEDEDAGGECGTTLDGTRGIQPSGCDKR